MGRPSTSPVWASESPAGATSEYEATQDKEDSLIVAPGDRIDLSTASGLQPEAALDGGVLRPVDGGIDAPAQGDHWLATASRDELGRISPVRWTRLRVDTAAPRLDVEIVPQPILDGSQRWIPGEAVAEASAVDELAGLAFFTLTAGDVTKTAEASMVKLTLPKISGAVTVSAQATDLVGHATSSEVQLHIDADPPASEILFLGPEVVAGDVSILAPTSLVETQVDDLGSGVSEWIPQLDGGAQSLEAWPTIVSNLEHGKEYQLGVEAVDLVGNRSQAPVRRVQVDHEAPVISWEILEEGVLGDDGDPWFRSPVTVRVGAEDQPAGLATLEADATPIEGPRKVTGDSLALRAVDRVGNERQETARWKIDSAPPTIRLLGADGTVYPPSSLVQEIPRGSAIQIEVLDAGVGLSRAVYTVGDSLPRAVTPRLNFPQLGQVDLKIEAEDRFGQRTRSRWNLVLVREEK